jgi:RNA recognition motif-containing protein
MLTLLISIVEFASQEDAQRAIRELSETALLGRPVFIREVCYLLHPITYDLFTYLITKLLRIAKLSHALALHLCRVRLALLWPAPA